jgi:SAM-dependent methyltransferase
VIAAFPELAALAHTMPQQIEHDPPTDGKTPRALLDHVTRCFRKIAALEARDRAMFQHPETTGLSGNMFADLCDATQRVMAAGLGPTLRAAALHLDIAKTTSPVHRSAWTAQGISLEVHNEAAAQILRLADRPRDWGLALALGKLAIAWVEAHGLGGQYVRGEGPILMFAPLVAALRELAPALGRMLGPDVERGGPAPTRGPDVERGGPAPTRGPDVERGGPAPTRGIDPHRATALALDGLHVLNACDTAAVREGLLDDELLAKLARVRDQLTIVAAQAPWTDPFAALAALARPPDRTHLAERLRALRSGRQQRGEPPVVVDAAVAQLSDAEVAQLAPALSTCQLWYCEAATSQLSPAAQLAVLAAAVGAARRMGVELGRPWHAQLKPLVARLSGDSAAVRYRLRLIEAALARRPIRELLLGNFVNAHDASGHKGGLGPLGTLSARLASSVGPDAVVLDYRDTDESAALVTLLGLYETRSQAAFHQMLKALCDLYGLRKDELDRVNNEAVYLASMNAARTDKERMLAYVRPGRIVEVGPGGGVVLDLLEHKFPDSEVIGIDLSQDVVAALESRARAGARKWRVIRGAAELLPELVPPGTVDTVVFCSILHEVYSYTEPRFLLASVERVVRAAWNVLKPGGRIVIRDGVMPPPAVRRIKLIAPDARPTFDLFVAQFEGREIRYRALDDGRVELSAADAMEFLYTYTWGPASFPYEIRELYGVMTYDDYVAAALDWVGRDHAKLVDIPVNQRSYLQPGYRDHLAGKIALTDERDLPAELPDSNCLIAIERR